MDWHHTVLLSNLCVCVKVHVDFAATPCLIEVQPEFVTKIRFATAAM